MLVLSLRRWGLLGWLALSAALGIWLFSRIWPLVWSLLWPFGAGALFALVAEGPVRWLTRRGMRRGLAAMLCLVGGLIAGALCTAWVTSVAWHELWGLRHHLPGLLASLAAALEHLGQGARHTNAALPPALRSLLAQGALRASDAVLPLLQHVTTALQQAVLGLPATLLGFFVAFTTAYFLCRDRDRLGAALTARLSPAASRRWHALAAALRHSVWGLVRAQLLLALGTFAVSLLGLWLIGAPYALLASLLAALFDFLPVLGPAALYVPWALGLALAHLPGAALGLGAVLLAVGVLRWSLTPHLFGSQVGLHPFTALAALYVGLKLAGMTGLLLGPLCAVMLRAAVDPGRPSREAKW